MLVLAHRGLPSLHCPENSAAAVRAAFDDGADGVEVDLRLTFDGVLAVSHDRDLTRLTGSPAAVSTSRWAELQDVAAASGLTLARAQDVLAIADGRRVVLEVKAPPPGPAAVARTSLALVALLISLRRQGLPMDVTVSSFSSEVASGVRRLLPTTGLAVRTALLGTPFERAHALLRQALAAGHDEVHPHVLSLLAEPQVMSRAHAVGVAVVPWTVNRSRDLRRCVRMGADAVITDCPAAARGAVAARRTAA